MIFSTSTCYNNSLTLKDNVQLNKSKVVHFCSYSDGDFISIFLQPAINCDCSLKWMVRASEKCRLTVHVSPLTCGYEKWDYWFGNNTHCPGDVCHDNDLKIHYIKIGHIMPILYCIGWLIIYESYFRADWLSCLWSCERYWHWEGESGNENCMEKHHRISNQFCFFLQITLLCCTKLMEGVRLWMMEKSK